MALDDFGEQAFPPRAHQTMTFDVSGGCSDHDQQSADPRPPKVTAAERTDAPVDNIYARFRPMFVEFAELPQTSPRRAGLRDDLVAGHSVVAKNIARRFANRGEPRDDLEQVAMVGLIQAVDRFDPSRGIDFLGFAVPTITGEIRRYFRDHAWSMRVPRRLKDLHVSLGTAISELSQQLGRAPTASELSQHMDLPRDVILEGLGASASYRSSSLDDLLTGGEAGPALQGVVGQADAELDLVEYRTTLGPLLEQLPERERTILKLRFFAGLTQTQIAEQIGISQMHVSRLLTRTLAQLRTQIREND